MCDHSAKLIAWMDGELPEREAAATEEHVKGCSECGRRLTTYRQASDGFAAYCNAAVAESVVASRRGTPRWVLAATGVAATVALFLVLLPKHRAQAPTPVKADLSTPTAVTAETSQPELPFPSAPATERSARRAKPLKAKSSQHRWAARLPVQPVESLPAGPLIEIAIPSDAIFPPGAMPEGMSFVANVTLGPDGSAARMGLRPRVAGFERRANP
jgi:anti-sigma factor RsiW